METTNLINKNEVKKELFKSKVNATFSHYSGGNLYYNVQLADGLYQFPISTIDTGNLKKIAGEVFTKDEKSAYLFEGPLYVKTFDFEDTGKDLYEQEVVFTKLSADLGATNFDNEVKGSFLNRWIDKAIESGEFVKVS